MVLLEAAEEYRVGDPIRIEIVLDPKSIPVARSLSQTEMTGRISRLVPSGAIVALDASATQAISSLKGVANSVSSHTAARSFDRAVVKEHNVKNRRHFQFVLVTVLLMVCIVWALVKILE